MNAVGEIKNWKRWFPRVVAGALGLLFLLAGLIKGADIQLFIRQIKAYHIVTQPGLLTVTAWGLIALECALGAALLVFYRPRIVLSVTAGLLVIFVAATTWAWLTQATDYCGCFGTWLKRTPKDEALENLILLALTVGALFNLRHIRTAALPAKRWIVAGACAVGLAVPLVFGHSVSAIKGHQPAEERVQLRVQGEGLEHVDLNAGTYLIVLMGTDCQHCQEEVPELNLLAEMPDMPEMIALCTSDEEKRLEFVEIFQPVYPIGRISEDLFWRLLGSGDVPRLILLREGKVETVWDQVVPTEDVIRAELAQVGVQDVRHPS